MNTPALGMILKGNLSLDNLHASLRACMSIARMPCASLKPCVSHLAEGKTPPFSSRRKPLGRTTCELKRKSLGFAVFAPAQNMGAHLAGQAMVDTNDLLFLADRLEKHVVDRILVHRRCHPLFIRLN